MKISTQYLFVGILAFVFSLVTPIGSRKELVLTGIFSLCLVLQGLSRIEEAIKEK